MKPIPSPRERRGEGGEEKRKQPLRLGVLDQSIAVVGRSHGESIRDTIALAQHCESFGYARFWVCEHHSSTPSSAPRPRS